MRSSRAPEGARPAARSLRPATWAVLALLLSAPPGLAQRPAARPAPARPKAPASAPAPAAAPATPRTELAVPFGRGETLTYDVSWSTYLTAGTATLRVAEKRPSYGSVAYYLVAEGRPSSIVASLYSLYYKADSLLDAYTLLPQRGSVYSEEGKRRRMKVTRFDHEAGRAEYEVRTATTVKASQALLPRSQDVLSAIYVMRAFDLRPNSRLTLPVADGGSNYRVRMQIGPVEQVTCGLGKVPAYRVTPTILDPRGKAIERPSTLWISTDPAHLPVKLQAELAVGSFVMTLAQLKK